MRNRIIWQAGLAVMTIVLTVVIIFAMTAAWYTNIIQTSGLVFEAEAWGFEGEITVGTEPITAGPGDDGVIHLEVANENLNITAVSVGISKARMDSEMQKRLYFYVDTQKTRNNETMERVYLNSLEAYTYTLFNAGDLVLTETMHNGPQLKWQWVYDVLGYYVLGTRTSDGKDVTETEYLRPIEYDYDQATIVTKTVENAEGKQIVTMEIDTVDGTLTTEEFLVKLSETDGYENTIDTTQRLESGHYPVAVDENGYGVYAYLYSYAEVELATQYDTALGNAAAQAILDETQGPRYEVLLNISAQKNKNSVINVNSLTALNTAMSLGAADVIQLTEDIVVTEADPLVIASGRQVMLDLNSHTITAQGEGSAVKVEEGGSLTMINGTIQGSRTGTGLSAVGAEAVLSNVTINDFATGVRVADDEGELARDSKVRLVGCTVNAVDYAVFVKGNGDTSAQRTQLIVEDCILTGGVFGICSNGSTDKSGTDIQVFGSVITADQYQKSVGIFHPQRDGILTVHNSTVTGYTGITIKGGSVLVSDSVVVGKGSYNDPVANPSGSTDTGDGIYIEATYGYKIRLEISGTSTIVGDQENTCSLRVYEPQGDNVTVVIYGGIFDEEQPEAYIAAGSVQEESDDNRFTVTVSEDTEDTETTAEE